MISLYQFTFSLESIQNVFVAIFYKTTLVIGNFSGKLTFIIHRTNYGNTGTFENQIVVFTKSGGRMNNTGTVFCRNKVCVKYPECSDGGRIAVTAVGSLCQIRKIREQRLIPSSYKLSTLFLPYDFTFFRFFIVSAEPAFCQNVILITVFYLNIIYIRSHG